jgi:hypothetical protein
VWQARKGLKVAPDWVARLFRQLKLEAKEQIPDKYRRYFQQNYTKKDLAKQLSSDEAIDHKAKSSAR